MRFFAEKVIHYTHDKSNKEMLEVTRKYLPNLFCSELEGLKSKAKDLAYHLILELVDDNDIKSMNPKIQLSLLHKTVDENTFINLIYVTDRSGNKITKNITQKPLNKMYREKFPEYGDFSYRSWFIEVMKTKKVYFTDLYTSKVTGILCITVAAPIIDDNSMVKGVLGIDIKFEDLI